MSIGYNGKLLQYFGELRGEKRVMNRLRVDVRKLDAVKNIELTFKVLALLRKTSIPSQVPLSYSTRNVMLYLHNGCRFPQNRGNSYTCRNLEC